MAQGHYNVRNWPRSWSKGHAAWLRCAMGPQLTTGAVPHMIAKGVS